MKPSRTSPHVERARHLSNSCVLIFSLGSLLSCTKALAPTSPPQRVSTYPVPSDPPAPPPPAPWTPLPGRGSLLSLNEYLEPPSEVISLLSHEPEPTVVVHAASRRLARLYEQALIPMSQLSRPRVGLAGLRIDAENRTSGTAALFTRVVVSHLADPEIRLEIPAPDHALIGNASFSPDGAQLLVSLVYSSKTQVGVIDTDSGALRILPTGSLSAVWGDPCSWRSTGELLCFSPQHEGKPPLVELKPNIQELVDGAMAAITYNNLLRDSNDDQLLEHLANAELFLFDLSTEQRTPLPGPGLITSASLSPNGRYLMTERLERPYPRQLPADLFQKQLTIFDINTGDTLLRVSANKDDYISTVLPLGPRQASWDPKHAAKIVYLYRARREHQGLAADADALIARELPFESKMTELAAGLSRVKTWGYTSAGSLYLVDAGKGARSWISYLLNDKLQTVGDGGEGDTIGDLSRAMKTHGDRGPILEHQGKFYFLTEETNRREIYYRLSEWDPQHKLTRPLWRNLPTEHASVFALLDPTHRDYLIRSETPTIPPYYLVSESGVRRAVTFPSPPLAELEGVTRQQIFYRRADSVLLSAMLYLPANFKPGRRLPTVLWIYPKDFSAPEQASRLSEHPRRYFDVRGPSRFALLTQGYALLDAPSMPIVGEVTSGRDDYLPQLIQSAEAAINYLVEMGISDRNNIAAVGRSYGAFAVANLMAHTQLFKTGVAMSGAYNRTLTPFGFQRQTRTFWQNTEAYVNLSPFFFANKIKGSLLLMHGLDDDNPGTPAFQSERFYAALAGNGIKSRYVSFPHEGHQLRGRRSVLHASAEIISWLNRHLKTEAPTTVTVLPPP